MWLWSNNVVRKTGNSCGREECNANWYKSNSLFGEAKPKIKDWLIKQGLQIGSKAITKGVIRAGLIAVGIAIPGGIVGYLLLEMLYQVLGPSDLH